jgi:hypothetical protein
VHAKDCSFFSDFIKTGQVRTGERYYEDERVAASQRLYFNRSTLIRDPSITLEALKTIVFRQSLCQEDRAVRTNQSANRKPIVLATVQLFAESMSGFVLHTRFLRTDLAGILLHALYPATLTIVQ